MIVPVLDLMQGQVVRAVAGWRASYRPIESRLVGSADPVAVAQAFRSAFGFTELYLADLDAIQGNLPALPVYQSLREMGFQLVIDAGLRTAHDEILDQLLESRCDRIIVGSETVAGPTEMRQIVERAGLERIAFSLDLQADRPIGGASRWPRADAPSIAELAISEFGIHRLIVLDLASVGIGAGVSTVGLCRRLKSAHPDVHLSTGGGVRNIDDVNRLLDAGVDSVLVASALHDGGISLADVARLRQQQSAIRSGPFTISP